MIPLSPSLVVAVMRDELDILVAVSDSDQVAVLAVGFSHSYAIWVLGGEYTLVAAKGHEFHWETPLSSDLGPRPSGWE